jgi:uncharacterized protein YbjT (DUF2867 family)
MSKKTYAVLGATGHIGHVLAGKLLEKGHAVRALGRDEKKLAALKAKGAQVLSPAIDDAAALTEAFKGSDGIFVMIPPSYGAEDCSNFQDHTRVAIVQAVSNSGVKHVVNLSSIGAEQPSGTGPIAGLYRQEQRLNKLSGVNILHLRPSAFMENNFFSLPVIKGQGVNGSAAPGDIPLPTVATQDIGAKAAELLDQLNFKGHEVFDFTGPREYSSKEVTAALGKAIGKPDLAYVQFSLGDVKKGLLGSGLKPRMVDLMIEMYKAGGEGKLHPTQPLTPERRGKTTIEEFAKGFAAVYSQS